MMHAPVFYYWVRLVSKVIYVSEICGSEIGQIDWLVSIFLHNFLFCGFKMCIFSIFCL